jgi:hypothetical protein
MTSPNDPPAGLRKSGKPAANKRPADKDGGIALYHVMRPREDFEKTAGMLWVMVRQAVRQFPGQPRTLYMDIEGHTARGPVQNQVGDYDADASEVIHFVRAALGPYLTETPWGRTDENAPQADDPPEVIVMTAGTGDDRMMVLTGDKDMPVRYDKAPALGASEQKPRDGR